MRKPISTIIVLTILVCVPASMLAAFGFNDAFSEFAQAREIYNTEWDVFDELDYGLYFYGEDSDLPVKAGTEGCNYDSTKPTIIYSHGWKWNEGFEKREVLSLMHPAYSEDADTDYFAAEYLDAGYNVASFFWNQIADEPSWDSVTKVWTTDDPKYAMRYRIGDNRTAFDDPTNPDTNVANLLIREITTYMSDFTGETFWLMGHSMGGELTLAAAEGLLKLYSEGKISENLVPDRLSLFDPFFPSNKIENADVDHENMHYTSVDVTTLSANAMKKCADAGMAIEVYATNSFAYKNYFIDENLPAATRLEFAQVFLDNAVWYFMNELGSGGLMDFSFSHVRTRDMYMLTILEDVKYANDGKEVATANTDIATVKSLMGRAYYQTIGDSSVPNAGAFVYSSDFILFDGVEWLMYDNLVAVDDPTDYTVTKRHADPIATDGTAISAAPANPIVDPAVEPAPDKSNKTIIYIAIAIAALGAVAAVIFIVLKKKKA